MARPKFLADDFWKDATLAESSEHENFTAENTQHRDFNKAWRSLNGAGSGWGTFLIVLNTNDDIDFQETAATPLLATLTAGTYDADTLCTEIKTQLEASGASGYTVTYSDTTNKFTIVSDGVGGGNIFELLWNTGANKATSVAGDIGFSDAADDTGGLTYASDNMRIHTHEQITADFGAAKDIYAVIIRGHNIESGATIRVEYSADDFASIADTDSFTVQDDILVIEYDTAETYRYVRIWIEDVDNADGYVSLGTVYVGGQFQPAESFREGMGLTPSDPSIRLQSAGGQVGSIQYDPYDIMSYSFPVVSEKSSFDTVIAAVGTSKAFFFIEDPASPLTTTKYVQATQWRFRSYDSATFELTVGLEEMR